MDKNGALAILRRHEAELRQRGVRRVALFGSVARNEARQDSDVDVLVEFDAADPPDLFAYAGIVGFIETLFPQPVEVVNRASLKPYVRPSAERDAVYAF
jgi:predicted nucleotidyltransferase